MLTNLTALALSLAPSLALALVLPVLLLSAPARADLDVVFVLDTTGSMSGELSEARSRARDLAEAFAAARPNEHVRMGVVAYRDKGDDYRTQLSPLSEEISVTTHFLDGLVAGGGGDAPEDVREALRVALTDLSWSPGAEHQLFLIADAPAHTDYEDVPTIAELEQQAQALRVNINAIGCRSLSTDGIAQFRGLAYATEGQYHHIGRVQADAGGLAAAMLQTVIAAPLDDGPLKRLAVFDSHSTPIPVEIPEATGILVRLGSWRSPLQRVPEDPGSACTLTVMLPAGMVLAGSPELALGSQRLHVTLPLAPGPGGLSTWELQACLPSATPIETRIN